MSTKLIVPVALGLSLVSVTAFVVYYIFKKDDENSEEDAGKVKTSRINTIEVKVPKSIVPALIGRGGSNIKELSQKSGATIHFKKFTDGDHDICIISGKSDAAQIAEVFVRDFINQQPLIVDESIIVPGWACGRIIGSGGETINDISHRSGAKVKISGMAGDRASERMVSIRGSEQQIRIAKDLIENCVAQEKCRREIEASKTPRQPVRSASQSPAPASEPGEEPPGDRHTHAKYKRAETSTPSTEVYVSAVSSPSRFWVQFVGPQVAQLDELVAHMTEYYGNKENREAHALQNVSVGQVVAAVFRNDGRWYRARIHDIRPNEFDPTQKVADVFFVDYGDAEFVAVHELCELRADLLRLRFQAMECFLAGVRPTDTERWDKWPMPAIERFEELTEVARWKPLISRTCTYKKTITAEGEKEKEIPGIKLYVPTDEGELDIGAVLIEEGYATEGPHVEPPRPIAPFGDLGNSKVLGMVGTGGARATSLPKDHKDDRTEKTELNNQLSKESEMLSTSKSLGSGLENTEIASISNFDLTYVDSKDGKKRPQLNGSHFLDAERNHLDKEASTETLTPTSQSLSVEDRAELKANMNRIDSHHNLESMNKSASELQL